MARNKLSNFFVVLFFSQPFFAFFLPTKLARTTKLRPRGCGGKLPLLPVKPLGWGTTLSKTHDMPKKARPARAQPSPGPTPSVNAPVACGMAWAAQLHAVMQHHAWAAAVQTPGGAAGQFAAHQALSVALRAQQAGAAGGGAVPAAGNSAKEASSFGPAVDQGHKSLAEMREERRVHPNMESVFRRTYSSPSALPSVAWTNYLPSLLSTRSLLNSCAS